LIDEKEIPQNTSAPVTTQNNIPLELYPTAVMENTALAAS
jgi:hypothetical protein